MPYEHRAENVLLPQLAITLDERSREGWELVTVGGMGAAGSRIAGAGQPVPVLLCIFRRAVPMVVSGRPNHDA